MEKINVTIKPNIDVTDWIESNIREGVTRTINRAIVFTDLFEDWIARCTGQVVLQKEKEVELQPGYIIYPKWKIYFEHIEDHARYLLTFDEYDYVDNDVAAFYCPYIPLSITNVTMTNNSSHLPAAIRIVTRYDISEDE